MKIDFENYKVVNEKDQILLYALLLDLADINNSLEKKGYDKIYIEYQDYHNEYSPERTDPCPDYYGTYKIYSEGNENDYIGNEMNINELDYALCTLINFVDIVIYKK